MRLKHLCHQAAGITLFVFLSCHAPQQVDQPAGKSPLVQNLEAIFYQPGFAPIPDQIFAANDYGAQPDTLVDNTQAIQKAIDAAAAAGGGKVILKSGIYRTGALFLKSNVELHLDSLVTIQAIQDDKRYPDIRTRIAGIEMLWPAALINIYEQHDVRITGKGIIDGNGKFWWDKFWGDPPRTGGMWTEYTKRNIRWAVDYDCKRVRPVAVYNAQNVLLQDFKVLRAGFWTISLTYSSRIHVDGLVIRNNIGGYGPSSDGINSDSSSDILVENCDIDCNDDNLCIKAGRDADGLRVNRPSENIVYRNCITRAGHGLFTIGSETSGGMRNIEVYGLKAQGTNTGIRFKSAQVRGGVIENIWFHDIAMEDVTSPFHFELNWYPEYSYPQIPPEIPESEWPAHWKVMTTPVEPRERGIPEFRNIRISDVSATGAEQAFYANAYAAKPIHDLTWENVSIEAKACGVIRHARNWSMKNIHVLVHTRDSLTLEDADGIDMPDLTSDLPQDPAQIQDVVDPATTINTYRRQYPDARILPLDPETQQIIGPGDTLSSSDHLEVFIFPDGNASLKCLEPLGDGFYYSPLSITWLRTTGQLQIQSEVRHHWTVHLEWESKPGQVYGANEWKYDQEKNQITAEMTNAPFTLTIQ